MRLPTLLKNFTVVASDTANPGTVAVPTASLARILEFSDILKVMETDVTE